MESTRTSPLIRLIVGSTRPVRVGDQLTTVLAGIINAATGASVEVTDLAELGLPMLDEPVPAARGHYAHEHTRAWSRLIEDSDAVVFVTPQYNGGYPAGLKNAIDYLYAEWKGKPGLIISYGGRGGHAGAAQLQQVLTFVGMDLVEPGIEISISRDAYTPDGVLADPGEVVASYAERIAEDANLLAAKLAPTGSTATAQSK